MAHVKGRQKRRLLGILTFLAQWEPVDMQLALVQGSKITLLPVDALTQR
jgi:hypothetical protein